MISKKIFVLLFVLIIALPSICSIRTRIGNVRAIVNVNASPQDPAVLQRSILVKNTNDFAVRINVVVDEKYDYFIDIQDEEFVLQPAESKNARYTATIDRGGIFEIAFNVGFSPADPDVKDNNAGLISTLIVNSEGPEIDDGALEVEEREMPPPPPVANPGQPEPEDTGVSVTPGSKDAFKAEEPEPNKMLVGSMIVAIIVAVGLLAFFVINKGK